MTVVRLLRYVAGAALVPAALVPAALAHSVSEVETELETRERYVQFVQREAPAFVLADAHGREVRLADLHGQVLVLNFVYARCRQKCPLHSRLMAEVQSQINEAGLGDRVRFVSIATDTEDAAQTAEVMRGYGARYGLDPTNWMFLHGGVQGTGAGIEIAKRYGLQFVPTPEGDQMHGVVTHVIDANGVLRARYHGLSYEPLNLTSYVAALAHGDHASAPVDSSLFAGWSRGELLVRGLVGALALALIIAVGRSLYASSVSGGVRGKQSNRP